MQGKNFSGRGFGTCKGPEVTMSIVYSWHRKVNVWLEGEAQEEMGQDKSGEGPEKQDKESGIQSECMEAPVNPAGPGSFLGQTQNMAVVSLSPYIGVNMSLPSPFLPNLDLGTQPQGK